MADTGLNSIEWYLKNIYEMTHWYSYGRSRVSALARPLSSYPSKRSWRSDETSLLPRSRTLSKNAEPPPSYRMALYQRASRDLQGGGRPPAPSPSRRTRSSGAPKPASYDPPPLLQEDAPAADGDDLTTFPRFEPFESFASVKPLWEEEDSTVDAESCEEALYVIEQDVEAYRIATRVKAITVILSASDDVPLASLSTDPAGYPEDEYGSKFFSKLTSHFYSPVDGAKPYPECLSFGRWDFWRATQAVKLEPLLTHGHLLVLQAILVTYGLNKKTAAMQDVVDLGRTLRWLKCPNSSMAAKRWTPLQLVNLS